MKRKSLAFISILFSLCIGNYAIAESQTVTIYTYVLEYKSLKTQTMKSQLSMPVIPYNQMKTWINPWQQTRSE